MELAACENALFALEPISRTVPTTSTRITASMTAYSAISWPDSSDHNLWMNLDIPASCPGGLLILLLTNWFPIMPTGPQDVKHSNGRVFRGEPQDMQLISTSCKSSAGILPAVVSASRARSRQAAPGQPALH